MLTVMNFIMYAGVIAYAALAIAGILGSLILLKYTIGAFIEAFDLAEYHLERSKKKYGKKL